MINTNTFSGVLQGHDTLQVDNVFSKKSSLKKYCEPAANLTLNLSEGGLQFHNAAVFTPCSYTQN
jgi:hypothetical protein